MNRGARFKKRPYFFLLSLALLFSCAGISSIKESGTARSIQNVPFYPQEMYQCGPASLAGVLNFWGVSSSPEEIAAEIYSRSAKGTLNVDLVLYAGKKGLKASHYGGGVEDVRGKIDSGFPLIVMVDYGFWVYQRNHFMIVHGYTETEIIAHSGREKGIHIPLDRFLKSWEKTRYWTLLVTK
jgi:ABC-type bacteriocin/lantibiotic exporter with double-glycine peptidase domain